MDLQRALLSRIVAATLLGLLIVGGYALVESHRQAESSARQAADSFGGQLQAQLRLMRAGIGRIAPFPDFDGWKQQTVMSPGLCVEYLALNQTTSRSLCTGENPDLPDWPASFETFYRLLFQPGQSIRHGISDDGSTRGQLIITPSANSELSSAWRQIRDLLTLSAATISGISLLVYLSIRRSLQPVQVIVDGLGKLEAGEMAYRLPSFDLKQWQRIASAVNQMAEAQQQLLRQRQYLIEKLQAVQEQERREIAGELHDEFAQCLAAINAGAAVIKQSDSSLQDDCERIVEITSRMQRSIRHLLQRLRPPEWDELGLVASLKALIADWNAHLAGRTRFVLILNGNLDHIDTDRALVLFRAVQEALTNIYKHAQASQVAIELTSSQQSWHLSVRDDGKASHLPFPASDGIGLLAMRERVIANGGDLRLSIAGSHGLCLEVKFPNHLLDKADG